MGQLFVYHAQQANILQQEFVISVMLENILTQAQVHAQIANLERGLILIPDLVLVAQLDFMLLLVELLHALRLPLEIMFQQLELQLILIVQQDQFSH